jgi:uncharacterized protein YecA (UPF0149 family)
MLSCAQQSGASFEMTHDTTKPHTAHSHDHEPEPHVHGPHCNHDHDHGHHHHRPMAPVVRGGPKIGRNDPCPCGSGKKFKKCCHA